MEAEINTKLSTKKIIELQFCKLAMELVIYLHTHTQLGVYVVKGVA